MRKIILSGLLISCSLLKLSAQINQTLYAMPGLFQSQQVNPAFRPDNKWTIQLTPILLPSIYLGFSNSAFALQDFKSDDLPGFTNKLEDKNYLSMNFQLDVLNVRFKAGNFDFNFGFGERYDFRLTAPGDFFKFLINGNGLVDNKPTFYNFAGFGANVNYYHDFSLGFSEKIKRLTYGVKFHYLVGVANVTTERAEGTLYTDVDYSTTATADARYSVTGLGAIDSVSSKNFSTSKIKSIALNTKNSGVGLDLGASYDLNDKFTVSASAINAIGYINWTNDVSNYTIDHGSYTFTGLSGSTAEDFTNFKTDTIVNRLNRNFKPDTSHQAYKSRLTPRYYVSGVYHLNARNHLSLMYYGEYYDSWHPGYTAAFDKQFGRHWNVALSYSIVNKSYNNLGIGTFLRIGAFETYLVTDNVLTIQYKTVKSVNLRLGMNLVFGRPKRHKKQAVELDAKKIKDRDKDFVDDSHDECPDVAGLFKFNGCPDTDGDGIPDSKDACPTVAGLEKFKGCPDRDNDGVPDNIDECPEKAGLEKFKGCPDTDNDSIPDGKDDCPGVKGLARFNGCPDSDGDGIVDSDDECPTTPGLAMFKGCADTDKDSVPDNIDACPTVAGLVKLKGCPEVKKAEEPVKAQLNKEEEEIVNKVFSNLEFENNKAKIKETSFPALDALYELLNKKPNFKLQVSGYTDNVGSDKVNKRLSKDRAMAVKNYLMDKGIVADRVKAEGFGKAKPIADNKTAEGRAKNRRVEFLIVE